jgi:hypothetical protein
MEEGSFVAALLRMTMENKGSGKIERKTHP